MNDYGLPARRYWWAVTTLGLVALLSGLAGVARLSSDALLVVAAGCLLSALAGFLPITIAGTKTSVSTAEIFVFLLLLAVGPDAAVVAAAIEAACISWRTSKRWTSRIASPAMAAIAMWVSAQTFVRLQALLPPQGEIALVSQVILLILVATVYFAIGTILIASLIKLKRNEAIHPVSIVRDHAWLGLGYACSAAIAGLLQASFGRPYAASIALTAVLFTAALLAMLHLYYRRSKPHTG